MSGSWKNKGFSASNLMKLLRKYPIENWSVTFNLIGWSVTAADWQFSMAITEKQALHIIGMIRRAGEICAMPNNLRRLDARWRFDKE